MSNVRALLISLANEAQKKQARGEPADLTPEVIAGFLLNQKGPKAAMFTRRVLELIFEADEPPPPLESGARGSLRLVK